MRKNLLLLFAALIFTSCAVVNVYVTFPEEKIQKAAEDLLAPPPADTPISKLLDNLFTGTAYAQETEVRRDIKTDSSVINSAKQKMDSWRKQLDSFKKEGYIGETNDFAVVIRTLPSDSKIANNLRKIVSDENRERNNMMTELIKINNVAPNEVERFKRVFAETMKKYSPSGTWIQSEEWYRKQ